MRKTQLKRREVAIKLCTQQASYATINSVEIATLAT